MKKNGHSMSPVSIILIVVMVALIFIVGVAALVNQQDYAREVKVTPTPSITPRTVRITEDPARPTSTPTPRLFQKNDVGVEIKQLQARLQELGYLPMNEKIDGEYGGATARAVEGFQLVHGLKADGIAGEQTLSLLYSAAAGTYTPITPTPAVTATPDAQTAFATQNISVTPAAALLRSGDKGEDVKMLQRRLQDLGFYSGGIDGDFGKGTKTAVELFQKQHDLSSDGIAGAQTLKKLFSDDAKAIVVTPTPEAIKVLSGDMPLLVNRENALEPGFIPDDLVNMSTYCDASLVKIKYDGTQGVRAAVDALMEMLQAAKADGLVNWQVSAAYRSIDDQQEIFDDKVEEYMRDNGLSRDKARSASRQTVADPGTSEHHTGLAFDMTVPGAGAFKYTDQCKWLHEHCWEYGFIIRYTDDKQEITGFMGEEWHIRYVGTEHSLVIRDNGVCLEEYLQRAVAQ